MLPEEVKNDPDVKKIRDLFDNVPDSMFALFGSISSWSLNKFNPLFEDVPLLRPCFVLFYVYSAWALLAVMTGVVSENMLAIREQISREDEQKEEVRKLVATELLLNLFERADTDGSGTVSREEFDVMLSAPGFVKKLNRNTNVRVVDLQELFTTLDYDRVGEVKIEEFMSGFKWVNDPLRAKSLVKLQERLSGDLKKLQKEINKAIDHRFKDLGTAVWQPLRKVHAIIEQMQNLDVGCRQLRNNLEEQSRAKKGGELPRMESRVLDKLDLISNQLSRLEEESGVDPAEVEREIEIQRSRSFSRGLSRGSSMNMGGSPRRSILKYASR